jgi:hypothetical protein
MSCSVPTDAVPKAYMILSVVATSKPRIQAGTDICWK